MPQVAMILVYDSDKHDLCKVCGLKPKFVENGVQHSYCSRTCARTVTKPSKISSKTSSSGGGHSGSPGKFTCQLCGGSTKSSGGICSSCVRKSRVSLFVQPTMDAVVREVRLEGGNFKRHRERFLKNWVSASPTDPLPQVEKIYLVEIPRNFQDSYDAYRACLPNAMEVRTYYSSQCICNLGTSNAELCSFPSCGICMTAKSLFHSLAFKEQFDNGRFGRGLYSYRNSSLADKYATSCITSPYRVSIECSAVVPEGTSGTTHATSLESVFVDTADAILPVCIIIYRTQ